MNDESLLEINKSYFRDIFFKRIAEKESKTISKKQFFKFVCNLKIYPDLLSASDLKKLFKFVLRTERGEKISEISYSKFEKMLKTIAQFCFPSGDSLKLLITHVKSMCYLHYQTNLINKVSRELKLTSNHRFLQKNREKSSQKQMLNKSASQKLSLSGLMSPRNRTQLIKNKVKPQSPSIELINSSKKPSKFETLSKILSKFKQKYNKILEKSKQKPLNPLNICLSNLNFNTTNVINRQVWVKKLTFEFWRLRTSIEY
jgi:hypothetical protein